MEKCIGLLRIKVIRGISLAKRDTRSSDPYVVIRSGKQKVRTRVVKKNVNPEWDEELTLSIYEPIGPIVLLVYDKDTFSSDDKMGYAEFDIKPIVEAHKKQTESVPNGTVITKVNPTRLNCLAEESSIICENGSITQHMFLRLKKVECGEVELHLKWIDIPGFSGNDLQKPGPDPQKPGPAATGSMTGGTGKVKKSEKQPKNFKTARKRWATAKMKAKWQPRPSESKNLTTQTVGAQIASPGK